MLAEIRCLTLIAGIQNIPLIPPSALAATLLFQDYKSALLPQVDIGPRTVMSNISPNNAELFVIGRP